MKVPLLDLQPQLDGLRDEIITALIDVVDSKQYILGPRVEQFEKAVADYCGTKHAVGVSSGTDALLISLMALDLGPDDLVATTPYTFFATMGSIMRAGARPLFVDIDPDSYNISGDKLTEALDAVSSHSSKHVKAIIPVHLYGQCAAMDKITAIADKHTIPIIEDAAQAIGAEFPQPQGDQVQWRKAGSMGLAGCFSFFPSKNLGGLGDGGMVVTNDKGFADKLRSLRNHGSAPKYYHPLIGGNFRLAPIQAAALLVKLPHLETWHRQRQTNGQRYGHLFADAGLTPDIVQLPAAVFQQNKDSDQRNHHIYNQYVIRVPERDNLRAHLQKNSIGCEIYYPLCLHQQECLRPYGYNRQSFPEAEKAARETLALPIYPGISREMQEYVVEKIAEFYQ